MTSRWAMTMEMMIDKGQLRIHFLVLFLMLAGSLHAQRKDFQSWWEAEVGTEIARDLDLSLEAEQRFSQNSLQYDRTIFTLTARYKVMDYLRVAGGFRGLAVADPEGSLYSKFRLHADATGRYSLGEVDLSLRVRFQYGFEEFIRINDISSNILVNRYRLKAAYHLFGTPLDVFASLEPWGVFTNVDTPFIKRVRYAAGLSYALGPHMDLGLRYIFEDEVNQSNPMHSHITVVGLTYEF